MSDKDFGWQLAERRANDETTINDEVKKPYLQIVDSRTTHHSFPNDKDLGGFCEGIFLYYLDHSLPLPEMIYFGITETIHISPNVINDEDELFAIKNLVDIANDAARRGDEKRFNSMIATSSKNSPLYQALLKIQLPLVIKIRINNDWGTFTIPFRYATKVNIKIEWGDDRFDQITKLSQSATHNYDRSGEYLIKVYGELDHLGPFEDRSLKEIRTLGHIGITSLKSLFQGYTFFKEFKLDFDVSRITDMAALFANAKYIPDVTHWNTSRVTNMNSMFYGALSFNQPIGQWDVSSVTSMIRMFSHSREFNQPIGDWKTGRVTNMFGMFDFADRFNQPIGDWDVSSVTDMGWMFCRALYFNQPIGQWKTGRVTNMSYMFCTAKSFNQILNDWDVSSVTDMSNMFSSADSFNQIIDNWNMSSVTDKDGMFDGVNRRSK